MTPDISIIIPAFNEEAIAQTTVETLDAYLASQSFSAEVLFVDDGSQDQTVAIVEQTPMPHACKRIVKLSRNFGSHAAIRAGLYHAKADRCALYYMDMAESPDILKAFYEKLQEGYEVVGSQRVGYKPSRGSRIYSWLQKKYICPAYPEDGISSFALGKHAKRALNENIESDSSVFLQIYTMGFRKCLIQSRIQEREKGVSKWTFRKKVTLLVDSFCSFSHAPLHLITGVGFVFALAGFLYALGLSVAKLFRLAEFELGFPMLISVLLLGFGLTNVALGVISEYLVRTLDASRRRPAFIVESVIDDDGKPEELNQGCAKSTPAKEAV